MYIADKTYNNSLKVPDLGTTLYADNQDYSYDVYIDKYARLLLQNALGVARFSELDSQIESGVLKTDADDIWKELVNGKLYTYNDKTYKWKGLIYVDGSYKGSVLTLYAYYNWHLDQQSRMSVMGETKGNAINSTMVSALPNSIKIWNNYISLYQGDLKIESYTTEQLDCMPLKNSILNQDNDYVSLLTFLAHNESNYPDCKLYVEKSGYRNIFGL